MFSYSYILAVILMTVVQSQSSRHQIPKTYNHYHGGYGPSNKFPVRKELDQVYEWKDLEFEFPTEQEKIDALNKKLYVPGNGVPIDVAVHYGANQKCRVFVTIPRFTTGIPMSLATVTNTKGKLGPVLKPYPNYLSHSAHGQNCDAITSVFRVAIDECDRMWVVDTGRIDNVQHCSPQLLLFDLNTDTLIRRYRFPESQFKPSISLFVTPIVDVRDPPPTGRCQNVKVYIADVTGFGIIVYDYFKNTTWRVQNKLMYPYPDYGTFTLAGESFDLMDGILGMDVSPRNHKGERHLFFHSLASSVENSVPLRLLDNQTIWEQNSDAEPRAFKTIGDRYVQRVAEAMDSKGNLFFGLLDPISLAYWNINTPYNIDSIKIISQNNKTLQFASGIKVVKNQHHKEELWVLTCRFQKIMTGTKSTNEINFRIQRCFTDDLLSANNGNSCAGGTCISVAAKNFHNPIIFPDNDMYWK